MAGKIVGLILLMPAWAPVMAQNPPTEVLLAGILVKLETGKNDDEVKKLKIERHNLLLETFLDLDNRQKAAIHRSEDVLKLHNIAHLLFEAQMELEPDVKKHETLLQAMLDNAARYEKTCVVRKAQGNRSPGNPVFGKDPSFRGGDTVGRVSKGQEVA